MKCGWGCGVQLTGRNMRAHFTICAKRSAASDVALREDDRKYSRQVSQARRSQGKLYFRFPLLPEHRGA